MQQRREDQDRFHEKVVQVGTDEERKRGDMDDKFRTHGIAESSELGFLLNPMQPTSGEERPHWVKPIAPRPQIVSRLHHYEVWVLHTSACGVLVGTLIGLPHRSSTQCGPLSSTDFQCCFVSDRTFQKARSSQIFMTVLHTVINVDLCNGLDDFSGFNGYTCFAFCDCAG